VPAEVREQSARKNERAREGFFVRNDRCSPAQRGFLFVRKEKRQREKPEDAEAEPN